MTRRWTYLFAVMALVVATSVAGVAQQESVDELRAKAEQGNAQAQYNLGVLYAFGRGVSQDYTEAIRLFQLAADQGHPRALYNAGIMFANGRGVPQDYVEAVRLYRLAAAQGVPEALYNLGVKYSGGQGVPVDDVIAHMWFNLAASRLTGDNRDQAVRSRDSVEARLTPEQTAEAQRLAREWEEAHPR